MSGKPTNVSPKSCFDGHPLKAVRLEIDSIRKISVARRHLKNLHLPMATHLILPPTGLYSIQLAVLTILLTNPLDWLEEWEWI